MNLAITDDSSGIRVIRLNRPPVNALNPALVTELNQALDQAVTDQVPAVVLAGGPKVFSAGLDVPALLPLGREDMRTFWQSFIGMANRLANLPVPVVAAIDGHSPAGGAVMALFCDWRVMARGPFRIGLNEVEVGLPVPPVIQAALRRQVGPRTAEHLLVNGAMLDSEQAHAIGFVDALCEPGDAEVEALGWLRRVLALPRQAMTATRREARRDLAAIFENAIDYELLTDAWFGEETRATMQALVEKLKAGR